MSWCGHMQGSTTYQTSHRPQVEPCFLHHGIESAMGQWHQVSSKHSALSLRQRCSDSCWTGSESCNQPGAYVPQARHTHSGWEFHLGHQNCYWTKPIYWYLVVVKESQCLLKGTKQGERAACAQKTQTPWWLSEKVFLKIVWGKRSQVGNQLLYNSLVDDEVNRMMFWESQLSTFWFQLVWGLCAGGQHAVNFLHLVGV